MSLQASPLEWLILRIIDEIPSRANDYGLERFFAKTDVCLSLWNDLRGLVKKNWLTVDNPHAQLKQYTLSEEGKLLLNTYNTSSIKEYVMSIEPTGFILSLLERMDKKASGVFNS